MKYKLLLGQCYEAERHPPGEVFKYPSKYLDYMLHHYAGMDEWVSDELIAKVKEYPASPSFSSLRDPLNIAGHFIAENISTPTKVIDTPLSPDVLEKELSAGEYSHVGIGIFVNSYSRFVECSDFLRENYPHIKIIAGNVGAMFDDTCRYADYICIGDGIAYLRELFGESPGVAYKPVIIPDNYHFEVMGRKVLRPTITITTQIGCPMQCDFCVTNKYFNGYFSKNLFSPVELYEAIMKYRDQVGQDFTIYVAEPTAITSKEWWYELFDLFRNEKGDFPVIMLTTVASISDLDLSRLINSALRIDLINIGLESFSRKYTKVNTDVKELIKRFKTYGIGIYITYIVGFDHTTKENIWNEIEQLIELDGFMNTIQNLHPFPGTSIWNQLKKENRLVNIPKDYYNIEGFQPFIHPHFKLGLEDMFPLMVEIYHYMEKIQGPVVGKYYELVKKLITKSEHRHEHYTQYIKNYKMANSVLYPIWVNDFRPEKVDRKNYQDKSEISLGTKITSRIPLYASLMKTLMLGKK